MAEAVRRILIVRPSALGDVCRSVPALATLRAAYPGATIHWLVRERFADAIRHHPALSGVVAFPRQRFGTIWRSPSALVEALSWARGLYRARYDLVVDLQGLFRSGLFTWITGAPRRIGYADARELGWIGCNEHHAVERRLHTVDRTLGLLRAAGFAVRPDMTLYVGEEDRRWLAGLLAEQRWTGRRYACLAPTAQWRCKCWPIDAYAALGKRLASSGWQLAVIASPTEHVYVSPLIEALRSAGCDALLPVTTVGQMMALVSGCGLFVGNDSAPLHVAVGLSRPLVAVFGPTDPRLVGPYQRDEAVVQPPKVRPEEMARYRRRRDDQALIAQVSVEAVWAKINHVLESSSR